MMDKNAYERYYARIKTGGFKRGFDDGGGSAFVGVYVFVYGGVIWGCGMLVMRHRRPFPFYI